MAAPGTSSWVLNRRNKHKGACREVGCTDQALYSTDPYTAAYKCGAHAGEGAVLARHLGKSVSIRIRLHFEPTEWDDDGTEQVLVVTSREGDAPGRSSVVVRLIEGSPYFNNETNFEGGGEVLFRAVNSVPWNEGVKFLPGLVRSFLPWGGEGSDELWQVTVDARASALPCAHTFSVTTLARSQCEDEGATLLPAGTPGNHKTIACTPVRGMIYGAAKHAASAIKMFLKEEVHSSGTGLAYIENEHERLQRHLVPLMAQGLSAYAPGDMKPSESVIPYHFSQEDRALYVLCDYKPPPTAEVTRAVWNAASALLFHETKAAAVAMRASRWRGLLRSAAGLLRWRRRGAERAFHPERMCFPLGDAAGGPLSLVEAKAEEDKAEAEEASSKGLEEGKRDVGGGELKHGGKRGREGEAGKGVGGPWAGVSFA